MNDIDLSQLISELKRWGNFNAGAHFLIKNLCVMNDWNYGEVWSNSYDKKFMVWNDFWSKDENYFEKFSKFSSVHKFAKGVGLIGKTWEQKKPLLVENMSADISFLRAEVALQSGFNAAIGIPILNDDDVLCVLGFFKNNLTADDKKKSENIFRYSSDLGKVLSSL